MKMYFEMLPGLPLTKELQQLAALPAHACLTATQVTRINMVTSVRQEAELAVSKYYRCRVQERTSFKKASLDLPKIIE